MLEHVPVELTSSQLLSALHTTKSMHITPLIKMTLKQSSKPAMAALQQQQQQPAGCWPSGTCNLLSAARAACHSARHAASHNSRCMYGVHITSTRHLGQHTSSSVCTGASSTAAGRTAPTATAAGSASSSSSLCRSTPLPCYSLLWRSLPFTCLQHTLPCTRAASCLHPLLLGTHNNLLM